tara:strand:+ start:433 stop:585 length:153 start_codon:yes stop_codon:yes gene_type:complete
MTPEHITAAMGQTLGDMVNQLVSARARILELESQIAAKAAEPPAEKDAPQ